MQDSAEFPCRIFERDLFIEIPFWTYLCYKIFLTSSSDLDSGDNLRTILDAAEKYCLSAIEAWYNNTGNPVALIGCKAAGNKLTAKAPLNMNILSNN